MANCERYSRIPPFSTIELVNGSDLTSFSTSHCRTPMRDDVNEGNEISGKLRNYIVFQNLVLFSSPFTGHGQQSKHRVRYSK